MITILKINGKPERELTPEEIISTNKLPVRHLKDRIEYLEHGDDAVHAQWLSEYPENTDPQPTPAMKAWSMATPEEKQQIANDLKNFL